MFHEFTDGNEYDPGDPDDDDLEGDEPGPEEDGWELCEECGKGDGFHREGCPHLIDPDSITLPFSPFPPEWPVPYDGG